VKSFRGVGIAVVFFAGGLASAQPANPPAPAPPPAAPATAAAAAAPAWKPFQEFGFLLGSWSGTAEAGNRIGGRVARFSVEMGGNYLVHRGSTVFAAEDGKPEESIEEVGYYAYDREQRGYVASYFFSTGVFCVYDVIFLAAGNSVRLVSRELMNYDAGAKSRLLITRRGDTELQLSMEIAPPNKEFLPYLASRLTKK
jgi:hypothetical protein